MMSSSPFWKILGVGHICSPLTVVALIAMAISDRPAPAEQHPEPGYVWHGTTTPAEAPAKQVPVPVVTRLADAGPVRLCPVSVQSDNEAPLADIRCVSPSGKTAQ